MNLREEIDRLLKQNETLIETLTYMGARIESCLQMLSAISSLTAIPTTVSSLQEASEQMLEVLILELNDIDACSLMLYDSDDDLLRLLSAKGQADLLEVVSGPYNFDLTFKPNEGIAGRVFADNEPLFWDRNAPNADWLKEHDNLTTPVSLACLPLSLAKHRMGVLNISFGEIRTFDFPRKRSLILLGNVVTNIIRTYILKAEVEENAAYLLKSRNELELRVQARTAELMAAGVDLEQKINERKKAEWALRESEQRYRSLVERTSDGFLIFEIPSGQFLFLNQRSCEFFGYTMAENMARTFWDMIAPEDRDKVEGLIDAWLNSKSTDLGRRNFTAIRKDGQTFLAEVSTCAVTFQGKPAIQGLIRDITEQERLRQRLQQTQKMEAIGTLAGGIAHDFNNILSAIVGYTELVQIGIPEGTKARRNVDQILIAGLRARDLVKQILAFSRQTDMEKKPLEINPLVREALKLLRASLPATIDIRQRILTEKSAVMANPTEMHQVVMNLCTNAGQAMREKGGVLEVSLDEIVIDKEDTALNLELNPGQYISLSVSDTGVGIASDVIGRIFEPYFTTKTKDEGTGLGLAVVHGIIKSHNGAVSVSSSLGVGTVFQVLLPSIKHEDVQEIATSESLPVGNERILFIDDEESLVDIGRQVLEGLGYEVTAMTSSTEALIRFRSQPDHYDLVITDQTMPFMTGAELSRELMNIRPDIPIIICTGFSDQISPAKASEMGIKRFATKPLVAREVAVEIRAALDDKD